MVEKILYSIIVFGLLVLFHEFGHFSLAKLTGVRVYEFSIGFGPRLFGFKRGETMYNLRVVPLGGFVRMAGMDPEEDEREATKIEEDGAENSESDSGRPISGDVIVPERMFMHKTVFQRMTIIAAGPLMNFVLAILLFAASFIAFGIPQNKNIIGGIIEGKPADKVGLKKGDVVMKINGTPVKTWEDIVNIIHKNPEKQLDMVIKRDGETKTFKVSPFKDESSKQGMIGITYLTERPGIFEAIKMGTAKTYEMIKLTGVFMGKMMSKQIPVELSGPVRITYELGRAAEMGINTLMSFAAFLSIQIGIFNLLPIPALDGSRLMFLLVEGVRGTPIDPSRENFIHLMGLALLLLLMVVITYQDIARMLG